jgi:hypothetical protein
MSLVLMELPTVRCGDMILEQEVMVGVMEGLRIRTENVTVQNGLPDYYS